MEFNNGLSVCFGVLFVDRSVSPGDSKENIITLPIYQTISFPVAVSNYSNINMAAISGAYDSDTPDGTIAFRSRNVNTGTTANQDHFYWISIGF